MGKRYMFIVCTFLVLTIIGTSTLVGAQKEATPTPFTMASTPNITQETDFLVKTLLRDIYNIAGLDMLIIHNAKQGNASSSDKVAEDSLATHNKQIVVLYCEETNEMSFAKEEAVRTDLFDAEDIETLRNAYTDESLSYEQRFVSVTYQMIAIIDAKKMLPEKTIMLQTVLDSLEKTQNQAILPIICTATTTLAIAILAFFIFLRIYKKRNCN